MLQKHYLCRKTVLGAYVWRNTAISPNFDVRQIRYGIRDIPMVPFRKLLVLGEISQSEKDQVFGRD